MRQLRFPACVLFAAVCVFVSDSVTCWAQRFGQVGPPNQSGRFIEPPRSLSQQLNEAKRAIQEGRHSEAVVPLGDLLEQDSQAGAETDGVGQDFFLDTAEIGAGGKIVRMSMLRMARNLIGSLPKEGRDVYLLRYEPIARKTLDDAAATRNWDAVASVRRKYFHTAAGYESSYLLAQREWLQGRPLATYILLEEVITSSAARLQLGAALETLFAAAASQSGRSLPDGVTLQGGKLLINGKHVDAPAGAEIVDWVKPMFASSPVPVTASIDYTIAGGAPSRNNLSDGELPLASPRWKKDTTANPRQEKMLSQRTDQLAARGDLPPPSSIPLRVGNQLLMRTTERLFGVDFRNGKLVWMYPWASTNKGLSTDEAALTPITGDDNGVDIVSQRVWNDLPFGQISSDGERVYVLEDLGQLEIANYAQFNFQGTTRPANTGRNTLVALELKTEGKLLWRLGASEDRASNLADAFFLGPPLPLNGRLYVLLELAGDICLSCLAPESGEELWRQQLVAIESGGIETDPIRRVSGAVPSYQAGVLVCPTGAGATVAVDLIDRSLRWGRSYERNAELNRSLISSASMDQNQLMQRWYSGAAITAGDLVLLTPVESDRLIALELLTGEMRFPEKIRVRWRYLAGVRADRMIVVGPNQVRAFHVGDGSALWNTPNDWLFAGQQISGVGTFGKDNDFLVPTNQHELIRISLVDGSVLERRATQFPLGNLVAVQGELISQSPTALSVAFGQQSLAKVVESMLAADPNQFQALINKAELLIQSGDRDEALMYLERARKIDPNSDDVYMLSVSAMLGSLRESPQLDGPVVELLSQLIDGSNQAVELLALRIRAGLKEKKPVETAKLIIELSELIRRDSGMDRVDMSAIQSSESQCSLDVWLQSRMAEAYRIADGSQKQAIDELTLAAIEPLMQSSLNVLFRVVKHFESVDSVSVVRTLLIEKLVAAGELLKAERLALGTRPWTASTFQSLSHDRLAALVQAQLVGDLQKNAAEVMEAVDLSKIAIDDAELAATWSELYPVLQGSRHAWPEKASLTWDEPQHSTRMLVSSPVIGNTTVSGGAQFEGWTLLSEFQNQFAFREPDGQVRGLPMEPFGQRDELKDKDAQINGSVAIVVTPTEMIGVNLFELVKGSGEALLWRRDWGGDGGAAKKRSFTTPFGDQVYRYLMNSQTAQSNISEFRMGPILGDRLLILKGGELVALDLMTGEPLWRNPSAPRSGFVLSDGNEVFVVSSDAKESVVFDVLDGSKKRTLPWDYGTVWSALNRSVVTYQPTDDERQHRVRLIDVFDDSVIEDITIAKSAGGQDEADTNYARIVAGRYHIIAGTSGDVRLWDLAKGQVTGQAKLPNLEQMHGFHALALENEIIVLPRRKSTEPSVTQGSDTVTTSGMNHQTTHAVHALSRKDAHLIWSYDDGTEWGCTLTQPTATPILLVTRSHSIFNTTGSRQRQLDVLALNVLDGSVMHRRMGKQVHPQSNDLETRIVTQPISDRVIVHLGAELLTYKLGEPEAGDEATESGDAN